MPIHLKRRLARLAAAGIALLTLSMGLPAIVQAAPSVALASAEPAQILINQASPVRFSADITDPNLIAGSVNLLRVGLPGTSPTIVGKLHDDGLNGDQFAGDGRYTIQAILNEPAPTQVVFRISAAFKGLLRRVNSADIVIDALGNRAPVAVAGPHQAVAIGRAVTLDGRQSFDPDGDQISFAWTLTSRPAGSSATLNSPSLVKPSFNADVAGTYRASLVVNDGKVSSVASEITLQAYATNIPPTAAIGGDLYVPFGAGATATASLNANASADPEGSSLSYAWRIVSKPASSTTATLQPLTGSNTVLTADKPGRYGVELIVNDGALASEPVRATVTFYQTNTPPSVSAGADQLITPGAPVLLNGVASDTDAGDSIASFAWAFISRPGASTASLQNAATANASFVADVAGDYLIELVVTDSRGAQSRSRVLVRALAAVSVPDADKDGVPDTLDTCPATTGGAPVDGNGCAANQLPTLTISIFTAIPPSGTAPLSVAFTSQASGGSGSYSYDWAFGDGQTSALRDPTHIYNVAGTYNPALIVTDTLGSTATTSTTLVVSPAIKLVNVPNVVGQTQAAATAAITAAQLTVGVVTTAASATIPPGSVISQSPAAGTVVAEGLAVSLVISTGPSGISLPPDPATVAPPIDPTVATDIAAATAFLYTGLNPIQTDVAPGTIEARRVAVLRGKVAGRDGAALAGVKISVLNHPEFGQTLTRADGAFDLAVNGGGQLTLRYDKGGFPAVQRAIVAPWRDYAWLPEVVMIPFDAAVTTVDLTNASMQTARGSTVSDADGARRATILFPAGTTAMLVLPNGSTQPLTTLNVRATEYTVGANGPQAMPAPLPPSSGYTYAVELSVDEAVAAGATEVRFSQAVPTYVENFLGFPVGGTVPSGYYDRQKGQWIASANGRVIKVLGITGGLADLDTDGDTATDDAIKLTALGVTNDERARLALLYSAGQTLWRVPVAHFTPWDFNWPWGPPPDAIPPPANSPSPDIDTPNVQCGSVIGCENQSLGESMPLTGKPWQLNYRSTRALGRKDAYTLDIRLSAAAIPVSLKRIELEVTVAGQTYVRSFSPAINLVHTYTWDGKDAYGRVLQGARPATVRIGYTYAGVYLTPSQRVAGWNAEPLFGHFSYFGSPVSGNINRMEVTLWQEANTSFGSWDNRALGLGGWSLSNHHVYDPFSQKLFLGDGRHRRANAQSNDIVVTAAGTGVGGFSGDGGPATEAQLYFPYSVAVAPDGTMYYSEPSGARVRRVTSNGIISTVAGNGEGGFSGDGGPATTAQIQNPYAIAVAPDGSLFITDQATNRIRRVAPNGIISTVAGTGVAGFSGDGGPATAAQLNSPFGLAVGPDGSLYILDSQNGRVRRVGPDGIISTVAGIGYSGLPSSGDGGVATAAHLSSPFAIAVGPDGSLFIAQVVACTIRRVAPSGIITTVAGMTGHCGFNGDGGPATAALLWNPYAIAVGPDGTLYIADHTNERIRRIGPDGIITTIAGSGASGFSVDNWSATAAQFNQPTGVAIAPDGNVYVSDYLNRRIRRIQPALPSVSGTDLLLPSEDGYELYIFNSSGRHLKTLDNLTGALIYQFTYSSDGYLTAITDGSGNVTTVERSGAIPTAIVAPGGQRTTLNVSADGWLLSATNPASEAHFMSYSADGLLQTFTDPRGNLHRFTYDALGRLIKDDDPAGGRTTLARTEQTNGYTVTTTSALGRARSYQVEQLPTGTVRRTVIAPSGTKTITLINTDGSEQTIYADGSTRTVSYGPDPRWGMLAPVASQVIETTPGGRTRTVTTTRTATLADPYNVMSLAKLTDTISVNGAVGTRIYNNTGSTRTLTTTTGGGRSSTTTLDALGRVTQVQISGVDPVSYTYDGRGLISTITEGSGANSRTTNLAYNAAYELTSATDALGRTLSLAYDSAGRLVTATHPGAGTVALGYDASGNTSSITPPARPVHGFSYTPTDQTATYTPPDLGSGITTTQFTYDTDRALTRITRPDGQLIDVTYDAAGRPGTLAIARGSIGYSYSPTTGLLTSITAPGGLGLSYSYDSDLLTGVTWAGAVAGATANTYNNDLRVTAENVNGTDSVSFTYTADGLLTMAGDMALTRNAQNGLLTGSTLGSVTDSYSYNTLAEPGNYSASYNATVMYSSAYSRDALGRITQKTEVIGGVSTTFDYSYDSAGRLAAVSRNGVPVSSYSYDPNGNRTARTGPTVSASYDTQDRLTSYGANTYSYTANGELLSKTTGTLTTSYQYDALGNLMNVTFPGGGAIDYLIDGMNRRIGKKVNGNLIQGFLYQSSLRPIAELDGSNAVVSRFVYATHVNVPDYMIKGGVTYRIITDQLGSPRLVVDVTTGAVAQRIDYDEFGKVISDSNPGFQPFGFAGGLYDRDTKLVRFGARDYDAETGRWTAKDPIRFGGGDSNLYAYAGNDPLNRYDPQGRSWKNKARVIIVALQMLLSKGKSQMGSEMVRRAAVEESLRKQRMAKRINKGAGGSGQCVAPVGVPSLIESLGNAGEVLADIDNDGDIDGDDAIEWMNPSFMSWEEIKQVAEEMGPGRVPTGII